MRFIERFIYRLVTWGAVLGSVDIGFCTMILCTGIFLRLFLGRTIPGTFDLVETAIVLVGAYSFVYCEIQNHHTKADVIVMHLKSRTRSRLEVLTTFLNLAFWVTLLYAGWGMLTRMYENGEQTELLKINVVPFRALWVLSLLLMCIVLFFKLIHHIRDSFAKTNEGVSK
ncbi:MAG TPA: TRAP transporter small permease [Syntrophorhabdaceae bacterium]|nr:TRAP transporter small permease [Syntrophorhabdaceae bacterium]